MPWDTILLFMFLKFSFLSHVVLISLFLFVYTCFLLCFIHMFTQKTHKRALEFNCAPLKDQEYIEMVNSLID